jgi:predicted nucleic acid-binding protein
MSVPDAEPERCFVDTNIWLYAFIEGDEPRKTACAQALLEASHAIILSTQVINEVCSNLLKKAQFSERHLQQLIAAFYAKYSVVEFHTAPLLKASALREQYAFSFWDSLIVASALHAEAAVLYSEDMQDGLLVENRVRIMNPFTQLPPATIQSPSSSA